MSANNPGIISERLVQGGCYGSLKDCEETVPTTQGSSKASLADSGMLPDWLTVEEHYEPRKDHDSFIAKSMLSITGVLAHFRLDDGASTIVSPSAPAKLLFGFACILLTGLSTNYFFVLVMLAGLMLRCALLPARALKRVVLVALTAAVISFVLMLPAALLGQSHSALFISTKALVSVGIALCVALTTPFNRLTAALRVFHVPNMFILTIDLALKSIVSLGRVALEVLTALKLRSVGKNPDKGTSLGGVGGVVFLKSKDASEQSYQAMCCRGFEGSYDAPPQKVWRLVDLAWLVLLAFIFALFCMLEGII